MSDQEVSLEDLTAPGDDDNGLVRSLRKALKLKDAELKDLHKQIDGFPTVEDLEPEVRAKIVREDAIDDLLGRFGHPTQMAGIVGYQLGDKEANAENVAEALGTLGYEVDVEAAMAPPAPVVPETPKHEALERVTNLSKQVASAISGFGPDSITAKINAAQTPEELNAIARAGGFLVE